MFGFVHGSRPAMAVEKLCHAESNRGQRAVRAKGRHLERVDLDREGGSPLDVYEDIGPCGQFMHSANRHYQELERELRNEVPGLVFEYGYARTRDAAAKFKRSPCKSMSVREAPAVQHRHRRMRLLPERMPRLRL